MKEYWKKRWSEIDLALPEQVQVGRTINRKPVSDDVFARTVDFVKTQMKLDEKSELLELCCGNGAVTIPLARVAASVIAVDFSEPLLTELQRKSREQGLSNVETRLMSATDFSVDTPQFSHILHYAALQHFEESDTICLFEKAKSWLLPGGIFYIGDIPDREKLWVFANTPEYERAYFDSVKNGTPAIGTWYEHTFLRKLAEYAHFSHCEIIEQPSWQINSRYRFDIKLVK